MSLTRSLFSIILVYIMIACGQKPTYDTIIRNGIIYDGTGFGIMSLADFFITGSLSRQKTISSLLVKKATITAAYTILLMFK